MKINWEMVISVAIAFLIASVLKELVVDNLVSKVKSSLETV